jgi:hypothetical protein
MKLDADRSRTALALAALYFGSTSIHALEVHGGAVLAPVFALLGLWLALAAASDVMATVDDTATVAA